MRRTLKLPAGNKEGTKLQMLLVVGLVPPGVFGGEVTLVGGWWCIPTSGWLCPDTTWALTPTCLHMRLCECYVMSHFGDNLIT